MGRSSPLDDAEACIYGYGALKFLTMNAILLEKILNLGILQLMVIHIKLVNAAVSIDNNTDAQKFIFAFSRKKKKHKFPNKRIMPSTS